MNKIVIFVHAGGLGRSFLNEIAIFVHSGGVGKAYHGRDSMLRAGRGIPGPQENLRAPEPRDRPGLAAPSFVQFRPMSYLYAGKEKRVFRRHE